MADETQGIQVLSMSDLPAELSTGTFDEQIKKFKSWMAANTDCHYYAAEKHEFSIWKAIEEAKDLGCNRVVVENLS